MLAVLLTRPFLLARPRVGGIWRASGAGRFVRRSPRCTAWSPRLTRPATWPAKRGVLGLVKVLALEGARAGICVSAICPGYVRTPMVEAQIAAQARGARR